MPVSDEFRAHVRDLFAGIGPVAVRRMFGGAGVYRDDACFALLIDGAVWMRADDILGATYASAGSEQWIYQGARGPVVMPYWRLPESAADDPDEAAASARRSLEPAERAAAKKRAARERKSARRRG